MKNLRDRSEGAIFGLFLAGFALVILSGCAGVDKNTATANLKGSYQGKIPPDENRNTYIYADRFNVSTYLIADLRRMNLDWRDISYLIVVSKDADKMIEDVLPLKQSGMSWETICERFGLDLDDVRNAAELQVRGSF